MNFKKKKFQFINRANKQLSGIFKGSFAFIIGWPQDQQFGGHFVRFCDFFVFPQFEKIVLLFEQFSRNFTHMPLA